ncbi:hypothetical protein WDZ17_04360 [Pseudokineococcus basanitobsidens]|uniref:Uncharacterized protein n=1 Tax=Pseudokineococcus basanitobsidens TaxID=1926649 RepID=A0ABU8RHG8_9ACTN
MQASEEPWLDVHRGNERQPMTSGPRAGVTRAAAEMVGTAASQVSAEYRTRDHLTASCVTADGWTRLLGLAREVIREVDVQTSRTARRPYGGSPGRRRPVTSPTG